jgi:hypothetical protein
LVSRSSLRSRLQPSTRPFHQGPDPILDTLSRCSVTLDCASSFVCDFQRTSRP